MTVDRAVEFFREKAIAGEWSPDLGQAVTMAVAAVGGPTAVELLSARILVARSHPAVAAGLEESERRNRPVNPFGRDQR